MSTNDKYLSQNKSTKEKKRTVVVIETNRNNALAVVSFSGNSGKHKTKLHNYQQGKSYY